MAISSRTILILAAALFGLSHAALQPTDPDLGWHLLGGEVTWTTGDAPRADIVNAFRGEWHDYHWLGQLALYGVYRLGGYEALRWGTGAFLALFFGFVAKRCVPRTRSLPVGALVTLLFSLYFLSAVSSIRPQLLALFSIAVAHAILERKLRAEIPLLFALAAITANVHVYWVFVPFLWFLYRVVPRIAGRRTAVSPLTAWGGMFFIGLAGFVSPYGVFQPPSDATNVFLNYALIWDYLGIPPVLYRTVGEFRSPLAYRGVMPVAVLGLVVLLAANLLTVKELKAKLPDVLALVTALVLAIGAAKYLGVLAVLGIPYGRRAFRRFGFARGTVARAASGIALAGCGAAALLWNPVTVPISFDTLPIAGCEALLALPLEAGSPHPYPRVLTHFDSGGWCRWIWRERAPEREIRVTTDNRTQGVPGAFFERAFDLISVRRGWAGTLLEWNPDAAVVPRAFPLAEVMLLASTQWRLVHEDQWHRVFVAVRK